MDAAAELHLASNDLPAGPIGLISQSGNLALEVGMRAEAARLGFARFASIGNQADLQVADLVEDFALAPGIEAIALYCEDFRDGRRFLEVARAATDAGTPVVMITVGASEAAARAARSHTGAMVSGQRSIEAACRAAGIEQVQTPKELVDLLQGLLLPAAPRGRRVAILADGGGHGAVAAEVAER
ncbi:CoA-binding protein, partial [Acidimicrobiaceae bacterium USS-CC1]|nr:CoA-binding protein [Acidiferrimicrobium australe]